MSSVLGLLPIIPIGFLGGFFIAQAETSSLVPQASAGGLILALLGLMFQQIRSLKRDNKQCSLRHRLAEYRLTKLVESNRENPNFLIPPEFWLVPEWAQDIEGAQ